MFSFNKMLSLTLVAIAGSTPTFAAPPTVPCTAIVAGNYAVESVAFSGELMGVNNPGPNTLVTLHFEPTAPQGDLGVWKFTNAPENGFTIENVGLGINVTTMHLPESGLFIPNLNAPVGTPGDNYAVQCAGNGQYVIKAVAADLLWTTVGPTVADETATIESLPSSGSIEQLFLLHAL